MIDFLVRQVIGTSNSYKLCQERESQLAADLALAQAQLFPLRKENTRLARENHQLHVSSIKQDDAEAATIAEQLTSIRKLNDKIQELQYLSNSKDDEIMRLARERDRIREVRDIFCFF